MTKFVAFPRVAFAGNVLLMLLRKFFFALACEYAHFYCDMFVPRRALKAHKSLEYLMEAYRFFTAASRSISLWNWTSGRQNKFKLKSERNVCGLWFFTACLLCHTFSNSLQLSQRFFIPAKCDVGLFYKISFASRLLQIKLEDFI